MRSRFAPSSRPFASAPRKSTRQWYRHAAPSRPHDSRVLAASGHRSASEVRRQDAQLRVVVLATGQRRIGLVVDQLVGQEETVIKSISSHLHNVPGFAGATISGDGEVRLILDPAGLLSHIEAKLESFGADLHAIEKTVRSGAGFPLRKKISKILRFKIRDLFIACPAF